MMLGIGPLLSYQPVMGIRAASEGWGTVTYANKNISNMTHIQMSWQILIKIGLTFKQIAAKYILGKIPGIIMKS